MTVSHGSWGAENSGAAVGPTATHPRRASAQTNDRNRILPPRRNGDCRLYSHLHTRDHRAGLDCGPNRLEIQLPILVWARTRIDDLERDVLALRDALSGRGRLRREHECGHVAL